MIPATRQTDDSIAVLFAQLGDVVLELNTAGVILRCHGPARRLGSPAHALAGRRLQEALPLEASHAIAGAMAQARSTSKPQTIEFIWTGESMRHFEARIALSTEGTAIALLRDIHDRKHAEKELVGNRGQLVESEARFRSMADHAPVLLWMTGPDSQCNFFNQRWMQLTGRSLEQEVGVGWAEGVHPEDFQRCMHTFLDAFVERRDFAMEYRLRDAAGIYRWIYDQGTPRFAPGGEFLGYIGSCVDMTDIHVAREKLRHLNEELEKRVHERTLALQTAVQELEAFSYSISHDLRGPLRVIDGFSHILLDECANRLDTDAAHMLRRIRGSAQHMGMLIDDLLLLSRVSRTELSRSTVDVSRLAREVVQELELRETNRPVTVELQADLSAHADERLVRILLDNLLGNAWKFTSRQSAPRVALGAGHQGGATVFFVRDNGAGFDMQYTTKLFLPFQRLHNSDEFPGTGVGLATARRIVERHGGKIWAESQINNGATFYFTLE